MFKNAGILKLIDMPSYDQPFTDDAELIGTVVLTLLRSLTKTVGRTFVEPTGPMRSALTPAKNGGYSFTFIFEMGEVDADDLYDTWIVMENDVNPTDQLTLSSIAENIIKTEPMLVFQNAATGENITLPGLVAYRTRVTKDYLINAIELCDTYALKRAVKEASHE